MENVPTYIPTDHYSVEITTWFSVLMGCTTSIIDLSLHFELKYTPVQFCDCVLHRWDAIMQAKSLSTQRRRNIRPKSLLCWYPFQTVLPGAHWHTQSENWKLKTSLKSVWTCSKRNEAALCRNWHFVSFSALHSLSFVNTNPGSVTIWRDVGYNYTLNSLHHCMLLV